MRQEVGGRRQRDPPGGRGLAAREQPLDLAVVGGEEAAKLRARELRREIDRVSAQVEQPRGCDG